MTRWQTAECRPVRLLPRRCPSFVLTATVTATATANGKPQRSPGPKDTCMFATQLGICRPEKTVDGVHPCRACPGWSARRHEWCLREGQRQLRTQSAHGTSALERFLQLAGDLI